MPETATTVTVDREVIVDTLVELVQYEEMFSMLNGHQDTRLTGGLSEAIWTLYTAAFGQPETVPDQEAIEFVGLYAEIDERGEWQAREWFDA